MSEKKDPAAQAISQEFTTHKEARASRCRQLIWVLKGLQKFIEVFSFSECKTVGNMNPEGLHCFSCTFNDIERRIKRAIEFWEKGDRYKDALS